MSVYRHTGDVYFCGHRIVKYDRPHKVPKVDLLTTLTLDNIIEENRAPRMKGVYIDQVKRYRIVIPKGCGFRLFDFPRRALKAVDGWEWQIECEEDPLIEEDRQFLAWSRAALKRMRARLPAEHSDLSDDSLIELFEAAHVGRRSRD